MDAEFNEEAFLADLKRIVSAADLALDAINTPEFECNEAAEILIKSQAETVKSLAESLKTTMLSWNGCIKLGKRQAHTIQMQRQIIEGRLSHN